MSAALFAALAIGLQQAPVESKLNIYFKGDWIGDMTVTAQRTTLNGKDVWHTSRKTEIRRRMGGHIPSTSEFQSWDDPREGPMKTVYSLGVYGELRVMTVTYFDDKVVIEETGHGMTGPFEPERREVKADGRRKVYGSVLDPFLVPGRVPQSSSIRLQVSTNARTVEETEFQFKGRVSYFVNGVKTPASEFHVMNGEKWVQRILVAEDGRILRVETPDGMTMIPPPPPRKSDGRAPSSE